MTDPQPLTADERKQLNLAYLRFANASFPEILDIMDHLGDAGPDPAKPFDESQYSMETSPLVAVLRESASVRKSAMIRSQGVFFAVGAAALILGLLIASLFGNATVSTVVFSVIVGIFAFTELQGLFVAWTWRKGFAKNMKILEEEALPVLRCMHLAAWAEPVYEFDVEDITMAFIQGDVVLSQEGPTAGLVVSGSTGEVLPRKAASV